MLNAQQKEYLINLIKNDYSIPEDYKAVLFPNTKQEYELTYAGKMKKEDLLADEDGTFPVPIQVERIYNGEKYQGFDDGWKNMIVFGDNLQFLKTIYENKDPVIKDKVKNKVKLIYIDPPFATEDEFRSTTGAKAYNDKKKGAEFLEFLRRRLLLAREILADDGSIFVHMDQKMGHYVKMILDEVFGKNAFRNEIVWCYKSGGASSRYFSRKHDNIFFYSKTDNYIFNPLKEKSYMYPWSGENPNQVYYTDEKGKYTLVNTKDYWTDIGMMATSSFERIGYPTQKPEALLERIIRATTNEEDLVMDFFGGSGTTMAVAEKLNRRWIVCDIGKLSYFTMQKRLLQIEESKSLDEPNKKYGKKPRSFMTATLGVYDLEKTLKLDWKKYVEFVAGLFEVELGEHEINGIKFNGTKRGYPVKIFNYLQFKESAIDDYYLKNLSKSLSGRGIGRIYIIAPASKVNYVADYEEFDDIRYYFLKVPYEMIQELHKKPFQKLRQPRSKNEINNIEEMIGFQFIFPPEVKSSIIKNNENYYLQIKEFRNYYISNKNKSVDDFETFSAVYIDYDFNGDTFEMDESFFADEILPSNEELDKNGIVIELPKDRLGKKIMVVYSDIYGNDFKEVFDIKGE